MTAYRGIEKDAVIDSLRRAVDFIRQCDLGPASSKCLDSWLTVCRPFEKLAAAADDREFAGLMTATRTSFMLLRFQDLFAHYALAAAQDGRDGAGAGQLYRDLRAWDAFQDGRIYEDIAAEVNAHIIADCQRRLDADDAGAGADGVGRAALREHLEAADWLDSMLGIIPLLSASGGAPAVLDLIEDEDPPAQRLLRDIFHDMTGLPRGAAALNAPHALRRYGIVPKNPQNISVMMEHRLFEFLEPYAGTAEVDLTSVKLFGDNFENLGVNFTATARVAREVAVAFQSYADFRLVDYEGADDAAPLVLKPPQP